MTQTSATEYFVSYCSCELDHCDKAHNANHTCPKCPEACKHWQPRSRCRLGCMTKEEVGNFKQKSSIDNFPDYCLRSVNELSFEIKAKRVEHIQVRENFELPSKCDKWYEENLRLHEFQYYAAMAVEPRRKMETQYGEPSLGEQLLSGSVRHVR